MGTGREPQMKRWREQRWLIDAVVRVIGNEWDQARISSKARRLGSEAEAEFRAVARRIRKYDDTYREFAAQAKKREAQAQTYEAEGRLVTAREAYLKAAILWSTACWPIHEDNETLRNAERKTNECFANFVRHAPYPVERVDIPFDGKHLPAYLHLPSVPAPNQKISPRHHHRRDGFQQREYGSTLR